MAAAEKTSPAARVDVYTTDRPGADFMVDVIKSLNFDYVCANPGSSFRGLHESLVNYGGNKAPELLTCCHEESSVAMAHGYFKIEGKPMMIMAHGTVGLQHASMAIYNAYADRVPVYIVLGNIQDINYRRGDVEWAHSVQDAAAMVRDYTKWDDTPVSLSHFAESAVRAYKIAMTPPYEPVVIVADAVLQEEPMPEADRRNARIPKLTLSSPPAGDSGAVAEAAKMLVAAENPVIVAGRVARTPKGIELLVELAETLQAPVQDRHFRMNFPSMHPLNGGSIAQCGRDAGARSAGLLDGDAHADADQPHGHGSAADHQTGREADHDLLRRSLREEQLSGLRTLCGSGSVDRGGCGGDAAGVDRGLQETDHAGSQAGHDGARGEAGGGIAGGAGARHRAGGVWVGCQSDQHGARDGGVVESDQERRLVTGVGRQSVLQQLAAADCGISRSTINTSAGTGLMASGMALRRRWARRWPIASTGA